MLIYPFVIVDHMINLGKTGVSSRREDQATIQFENLRHIITKLLPTSILDLGCGWAIIDILIARHAPVTTVHLVDGDGIVEERSGFKDDTQAWADVRHGGSIVRANLGSSVEVIEHFANPDAIDVQVDLVISCRSWAHHYPVSIYADTVRRCLKPGGHVITDVRNGTKGLSQLQEIGLVIVEQIPDKSVKCTRWLLKDVR